MKIAVTLAAAFLLSGCSVGAAATTTPVAAPAASPAAFHGREPLQPSARPAFVLTDTSGAAYDFTAQTAGKPTLLYFGYTNCPDECPTAMADIAGALRQVPESLRSRTRVVFVTTDPDRDTAPLIRRFLDQFSVDFVGLRGTQAQVDAAAVATGAAAAE
ncbi:MAG: SCO family protein, partial [Frankiales bacterium]|nr:SCO family protein [Frankiales bacterium]